MLTCQEGRCPSPETVIDSVDETIKELKKLNVGEYEIQAPPPSVAYCTSVSPHFVIASLPPIVVAPCLSLVPCLSFVTLPSVVACLAKDVLYLMPVSEVKIVNETTKISSFINICQLDNF